MLARHLLFIATRRPHNSLLTIPPDSISAQPPPYIGPPAPEEKEKSHKYKEILNDSQGNRQLHQEEIRKQANYNEHQRYAQSIYARDNCQHYYPYNDDQKFFERNRIPTYCDYQRNCEQQSVQIHNAKNQQFCMPGRGFDQQFYTLPSRRPQREIEPPRSVTPDITRGLGRGSLSTMHMLARQGQKPVPEQDPRSNRFTSQVDASRRNMEQLETRNRLVQQQTPIVDVRNRFATPLSLSALGYRFFASSPVNEPTTMSASTDVLKHNPISPIGPGYGNGFKSSTPTSRSAQTVAERLALTTGNCPSPVPSSSGRSTPVQTSSGRNTPTNLILSPTKSTMSNEELFAAIHKSKKRLNIKDDNENMSPYGSMNSLVKTPAGSRHSWSPESQKQPEIPQTVHSPSSTSRLDFKRLLLQQSVKVGPTRLSAAEQLKLSRQQCQQQQPSPTINLQTPLTKVLSPRSVWRFQTPRTDVLSSTIIEDTAAEEKAMKPSPESTSPISRLNSRRQLDLGNDPPNRLLNTMNHMVDRTESCDDRLSPVIPSSTLDVEATKMNEVIKRDSDSTEESANVVRKIESKETRVQKMNVQSNPNPKVLPSHSLVNAAGSTALQYSQNSAQLTPRGQEAVNAIESRRLSNQLARAQFLANAPINSNQGQSAYFGKRFRARSESPKHVNSQNVARSPSAPTLETAL
ncbi:hypothetical protein KPH14_010029 [Odynerus spinipes]|uniref:Uncharacterized protein n=1 Tax=Odynerus spinipes TaxID=1348599 RepID=A0AAD9VSP6_9HYME|nr:hypothetical protein KPH14_010029 [Odynerus spinipes]